MYGMGRNMFSRAPDGQIISMDPFARRKVRVVGSVAAAQWRLYVWRLFGVSVLLVPSIVTVFDKGTMLRTLVAGLLYALLFIPLGMLLAIGLPRRDYDPALFRWPRSWSWALTIDMVTDLAVMSVLVCAIYWIGGKSDAETVRLAAAAATVLVATRLLAWVRATWWPTPPGAWIRPLDPVEPTETPDASAAATMR